FQTFPKAHIAAERLIEGDDENFQDLAQLLKARYGTRDFTTVDVHDLEDQIQELVLEGWVEIEPEFFTDHQGKQFKVVARLKRIPEAA
ncbi:Site-specific recombinase, phage integrase family domain protein, partial [Pseudomonas cannabina pv. alisalensis]